MKQANYVNLPKEIRQLRRKLCRSVNQHIWAEIPENVFLEELTDAAMLVDLGHKYMAQLGQDKNAGR